MNTPEELESFILGLFYRGQVDQIESQQEFWKWLGNLNIKQFLSITDIIYYKDKSSAKLEIIEKHMKKLPLAKPLIQIIIRFLSAPPKDTLATIGFGIVEWLYMPSFVMTESKDPEVIKEIYKRSAGSGGYDLDDQVLEDWLDANEGKKGTDKYNTLKEILEDMQSEEGEENK